jgi:Cu(I)/Ag(I) efflux system membrane protein CusA/SilA
VVTFVPVFMLTDQEGKLFRPLAFTKTFALVSALIVALSLTPVLAHLFLRRGRVRQGAAALFGGAIGGMAGSLVYLWADSARAGAESLVLRVLTLQPEILGLLAGLIAGLVVIRALTEPLLPIDDNPVARGIVAVYTPVLKWVLGHKFLFSILPVTIVLWGGMIWLGANKLLAPLRSGLDVVGIDTGRIRVFHSLEELYPGIGREFMPPLDEGGLLFMPSLLPQASLNETVDLMLAQNRGMMEVPEVMRVVGKAGRAETALDPAPVGMVETVLALKPRHKWREGMTTKKLIAELRRKTNMPGVAPSWLQPIETRVVMLQSGIRASIGQRIFGPDFEAIEKATLAFEQALKGVPGASDVTALRLNGKPYLEIHPDRERLARYGLNVEDVQRIIEVALGGVPQTRSVEGRERYPVRVRYARDYRDRLNVIESTLVPTKAGSFIPLRQLADVEMVIGPASIRSEDGRLVGYVMFNAVGKDEVSVVEDADRFLKDQIASGSLDVPEGVYWDWRGRYQNQVRANKRLSILVPVCLLINLLLLFFHFQRMTPALLIFLAIPVAMAGGFIVLDWYGAYLTVAVWVGFIALFGIAVDDGVVMGTYILQVLEREKPTTAKGVREAILHAGQRRIRPAMMTTVTTVLALLPIFLTEGRGSDVMRPMAIPSIGGMLVAMVTWFVVPMGYSAVEEWRARGRTHKTGEEVS